MSYILEAIRRSEEQRQGSAAPSWAAAPMFTHVAKGRAFVRYGIASAALIAAGIMISWLGPWGHAGLADATTPFSTPLTEARARQDTLVQPAPLEHAHPAPPGMTAGPLPEPVEELHVMVVKPYTPKVRENAKARAARPPREPMATAKPERPHPTNRASGITAQNAPAPQAAEPSGQSAAQAPGDGKVLAMYELPPAIGQEIPQMSISGFSYSSTPKERIVGINDRLIQEGQYLADGLRLEQITPDSLIFSYKTYRFRKSLQ